MGNLSDGRQAGQDRAESRIDRLGCERRISSRTDMSVSRPK